jgi:hypothetical protein
VKYAVVVIVKTVFFSAMAVILVIIANVCHHRSKLYQSRNGFVKTVIRDYLDPKTIAVYQHFRNEDVLSLELELQKWFDSEYSLEEHNEKREKRPENRLKNIEREKQDVRHQRISRKPAENVRQEEGRKERPRNQDWLRFRCRRPTRGHESRRS